MVLRDLRVELLMCNGVGIVKLGMEVMVLFFKGREIYGINWNWLLVNKGNWKVSCLG